MLVDRTGQVEPCPALCYSLSTAAPEKAGDHLCVLAPFSLPRSLLLLLCWLLVYPTLPVALLSDTLSSDKLMAGVTFFCLVFQCQVFKID